MNQKRLRRDAGLTMIEVVVASIILTAMIGMSSYLVWNSSRTVAAAEVGLQLETNAREFLTNLNKELHQTKMSMVSSVLWDTNVSINPVSRGTKGVYVPGGSYPLSSVAPGVDGTIPSGAVTFRILRMRLPGASMDLTKSNANYNKSTEAFNLKKYITTTNNDEDYTYEIQYWWEIDNTDYRVKKKDEGVPGAGPGGFVPNGVDDNGNGLTDEGVIRKLETWFKKDGSIERVGVSTVLRNVPWIFDPAFPNDWTKGRPGLVFCIPNTDGAGVAYSSPGTEKRIFVSLTVEAEDPRYPGKKKLNYFRTFSNYIDVRNF